MRVIIVIIDIITISPYHGVDRGGAGDIVCYIPLKPYFKDIYSVIYLISGRYWVTK